MHRTTPFALAPSGIRSLTLAGWLGAGVTLLAACAAPPAAQQSVQPTPRSARDAIVATSQAFSRHYERGEAEAMVAIYTPDGVILPPGRAAMQGPEALRQYWTLPPGMRVLEHRATPDSIVVAGPVAYDWGTYHVRTQDASGTARETHGKYVIVWRETAPGTWRMHVDMWNSGPPATAAPAR